jgi:hypothetical protein
MPTDQSVPASAALGQSNDAPLADISAAIIGQLQELLLVVTRLNKQQKTLNGRFEGLNATIQHLSQSTDPSLAATPQFTPQATPHLSATPQL